MTDVEAGEAPKPFQGDHSHLLADIVSQIEVQYTTIKLSISTLQMVFKSLIYVPDPNEGINHVPYLCFRMEGFASAIYKLYRKPSVSS